MSETRVLMQIILPVSDAQGVRYYPGEQCMLPAATAEEWSQHGWAKDPSGKIPYTEPVITGAKLAVAPAGTTQSTKVK